MATRPHLTLAVANKQAGNASLPADNSAFLTVEQFCALLGGIAPSTFHDWKAKGKAPQLIKLPNGRLLIRRAEFERWLEALEVA